MNAPAQKRAADSVMYEIVGVVRDFDLNPDDSGDEQPFVFHTAAAATAAPLVMRVRVRGNPATLAARHARPRGRSRRPAGRSEAQPMATSIWQRDDGLMVQAGALSAVTLLVLFLSALGIFSLMSVIVSRRTREIGLRAALGASARHVLVGILSRAALLMAGGIVASGTLVFWPWTSGWGPSGRPADDVPLFAGYLAVTSRDARREPARVTRSRPAARCGINPERGAARRVKGHLKVALRNPTRQRTPAARCRQRRRR